MPARSTRRRSWLGTLVLLAVVLLLVRHREFLRDLLRPGPEPGGDWYEVVEVIDGDTITVRPNPSPWLERGDAIRLIGVNTPETRNPKEYYSQEARAFVRDLTERRRVRLAVNRRQKDRFERTLAYVYLEDGTLLNEKIIREGYGCAFTRYPFDLEEKFVAVEREAQNEGRGLWAEYSCAGYIR